MLTTLLRPTGGSATVAGHDVIEEAADVRRAIGVALQEAALDPLMTGRELIQLQATLHGIPRPEGRSRAEQLMARVGLESASDRRIGRYSAGMRRRLDLASALVDAARQGFVGPVTWGETWPGLLALAGLAAALIALALRGMRGPRTERRAPHYTTTNSGTGTRGVAASVAARSSGPRASRR